MPDKSILTISLLAIAAMAPQAQAQQAQQAQAEQAMTVVRDAETGKLRAPTAAEARALQGTSRARNQGQAARPQSVVRPDGTRALDLGDRGLVYSVTTRNADGKLVKKCVKGDHALDAIDHKGETRHDHQ
ncbi:MAG: hypothetical protein V4723_03315 [Pseudomonadota bacterium]